MLSIKNLSVNYGSISALRDENIEVRSGELVTLIGGNGAGKRNVFCMEKYLRNKVLSA